MNREPVWLLYGDDGYEFLGLVPARLVKVEDSRHMDLAAYAIDRFKRGIEGSGANLEELAKGDPIPHADAKGELYSGEPVSCSVDLQKLLAYADGSLSYEDFLKICG